MSVPVRSQEDPYAFTETAPLPANTTLFKQQQATVSVASSPAVSSTPTSVPIIQAGTSLLANNNNANSGNVAARLNHVVQQRTLLGTTAAKLAPIKVTLVQSPSGGILGKARLNGTTITSSPQGTVFRTVTVPQATTIVQRQIAQSSSGAVTTPNVATNATPTVFTKPLQVQISPQQAAAVAAAGGKFTARRILASKSPNVSPVTAATAVSGSTHPTGVQTVRIVKTTPANVLQTVSAGRTAISADGTRRFISHSGATSLLGSPVVVTTSAAPGTAASQQQQKQQQSSPQQLPTISPTKIRLIQPQPQGKIFLHTPNSSNSLAAATHISNPISIAALRNSLAKQNPSLLNKIVVQQQQHHQQSPQQVQIAVSGESTGSPSTSNGLPTVRMIPTSTAVTAINIRRAVSAASATATSTVTVAAQPKRQMSLETGTTTVMVPTMAKPSVTPSSASPAPVVVKQVKVIPASTPSSVANRPPTIQIPQTLLQQRAKTPTQSILKPQPPRPQPPQSTSVATAKTPQKLVIAAPKTVQQQQLNQQQQQQLHPQQVMVLASPKSLGAGGQQQQQVMVVTAPKGLGGHQQHQVVVLAPFKPGQLTAVNRQPQQLVATTSLMKQIQQQQQQQILTGPVVKTIQKVQQQPPQQVIASPKQIQQPQVITTSPVVKQVVQNQIVAKPPQQLQQVLATSVAKTTIQQRQFVTTSIAKSIQQQQQQVVVTSLAKPPNQQPAPQQVVATSIVKPQQQPQTQQVVINAAPKPPPQQQQQQQQQAPQQQFVVVPPPKPVPQPSPSPQVQQQPTPQPMPVTVASTPTPTPPPPAPTPPVSQPQDDFTIPSFIIPKQKEVKKVVQVQEKVVTPQQPVKQQITVPVVKSTPVAVPQPPPPPPPSQVSVAPQVQPTVAVVPPPPIIPEPQLPSTSTMLVTTPKPKVPKESGGGKSMVQKRAAKRSYSRSSHNETLERIDEPAAAAAVAPPMPKIHKWTPPAAISVPVNREWHAPDSWIFDICPPGTRSYEELKNAPLTMDCWFEEMYASSEFDTDLIAPRKVGGRKGAVELPVDDGELVELSLKERSEQRKALKRRRAIQYWNAQRLRDPEPARKRLKSVERVLNKLDKHREMMLSKNGGIDLPKCLRVGCERDALLATTHCRQHIADNTEQRLFQRCTAKFSDNSQCQVPVFDIRQELVLCREHAWKHDNHDKMSAEVRLLKKPAPPAAIAVPTVTPTSITLKKKLPKMPLVKVVQPVHHAVTPTANKNSTKASKKKKKLTPFQQQMALHQQQYKQQYAVKPTLPPPPYPSQQQQQVAKQQPVGLYRQQSQPKYHQQPPPPAPVQIVPPTPRPPPQVNRNLHIPLNQHQQQQTLIGGGHQQQHLISRNEDLMLNYQGQSQQQQQYSHQQVQQILAAAAAGGGGVTGTIGGGATQDLLNICENSSAYASSEDTGVGGLSESELMAAQDVIEEIPFEIGNLNNVLSQLPPDAFNELLFSEQEQNGPPFESTREEEEDLERALEVVGEHVKSLEDMTVESANLFGDFLDNVDDEMLDGPDMCAAAEQMLVVQSPGGPNDIRGLVHT